MKFLQIKINANQIFDNKKILNNKVDTNEIFDNKKILNNKVDTNAIFDNSKILTINLKQLKFLMIIIKISIIELKKKIF